ncbi:MAG: tRNA uridine-5-carboxymethylaminomethyl(34) synthesis GTPase MnmE [Balneolaceae bacterium]|nr:MAG: tRNA uridine-5-carboxymethylaminomethyl(34) synthesis GTPase MnmE [Balneolaceae bacterium]
MKDSHPSSIQQKPAIAAIATALGEAGISVIRVSGEGALEKVSRIFRGKDLAVQPTHTAHFGRIMDRPESTRIIDEVVATIFRSPKSYTGEDTVEISCHGGVLVTQEVLEAVLRQDVRHAEPGEFTLRAFLNGKLELSQAEAVADMIHAKSRKAVEAAGQQLEGELGKHVRAFRQQIIDATAMVELELDFIEEDVEFANKEELRRLLGEVRAEIGRLLETYESGRLVKHGVQTVFVGRPNSGKSTLLNTLMGKERAIVSATAGTTRDVIDADWSYEGLTFTLTDTAGLRETVDEIEAEGVRRSESAVAQADLILYLADVNVPPDDEEQRLLGRIVAHSEGKVLLKVGTKLDLADPAKREELLKGLRGGSSGRYGLTDSSETSDIPGASDSSKTSDSSRISGSPPEDEDPGPGAGESRFDAVISAKDGMGIEELKRRMRAGVLHHKDIDTGQVLVTSTRHRDALEKARHHVEEALRALDSGMTGDFLSIDLRAALNELGTITGEITTEDLLDSIFSRFCIGK